MGAKRASRNRKKNAHHTDCGHQKRAMKYVQKELKRMRLRGGQFALRGFRVHPEFGWCHKALLRLGYVVDLDERVAWRKQRNLRQVSLEVMERGRFEHVRNNGLCLVV